MIKQLLAISVLCICICGQISAQIQSSVDITDQEYEAMLQGMADKVLYKFDNMPSVHFVIKDDSRFYKNGKLHALAFYTKDEKGKPIVYVNPNYHKESKTLSLADTVFHELTHAWVSWKGLASNVGEGHNEAFIKKALELRLDLLGTLAAFPEAREIYDKLVKSRPNDGGRTDGDPRGCNPIKTVGCFGLDLYQYQFFELEESGEFKFKESRLFKFAKLPEVGANISFKFTFVGKNWRVNSIRGSIVQLLEIKGSVTNNCDPVKDKNCFGESVYLHQFISNPKDNSKIGSAYLKTPIPITIGTRVTWRNQKWKCYALSGSVAWFEKDNIFVSSTLTTIKKNKENYYVRIPADGQWHQVIFPEIFNSQNKVGSYKARLGVQDKSISIIKDDLPDTLDNKHYLITTVSLETEMFVKSDLIQNNSLKLELKVMQIH